MRDVPGGSDPLLDAGVLRRYLRSHHRTAHGRSGQHFLVDPEVLKEIVTAAETDARRPVIEIGAGLGTLTRALAQAREAPHTPSPAPMIAVEIDRTLTPLLRDRVRMFPAVIVVEADILRVSVGELLAMAPRSRVTAYDVVGNIPYHLSSPILEKFLRAPPRPQRLTLLLDESVAEALAARPPDMRVRTISTQLFATVRVVRRRIPPSVFVPPPAVHSAIVVLTPRPAPLLPRERERAFFRLVRAGFSQRRKVLANALAATYRIPPAEASRRLKDAGVDPRRRAETLSLPEWQRLLAVWEVGSSEDREEPGILP